MAKIWYSIFGEGMGHAIRSWTVIQELKKKHKIFITVCGKAVSYIKKKFPDAHEIQGYNFVYENNSVAIRKTASQFLKTFFKKAKENNLLVFNQIKKFKPDLIISDFEPTSHYFSWLLGIPIISLDNINILAQCDIKISRKYFLDYINALGVIKLFHPRSDYYLIPSIINLRKKNDSVFLFPPVLRKEILELTPKNEDFILVYLTSSTYASLTPVLKSIREKFIIYGMNKSGKDKNLEFKNFSEKGFIEDLRSCKAAIVNGGFTVLGEALYLKKPLLVVPIKNQFEQTFNGMTVRKQGFGDWHKELEKKNIESFISLLKFYSKNLNKLEKWDNHLLFKKLDELIEELAKEQKPVFNLARKIENALRVPQYERTLTIIKPDAVEKGLVGEVIKRLEKQGVKPVAMKMIKINQLQARKFYSHLKGRVLGSVFNSIVQYMTSNRVVLTVWQGKGVVGKVRKACGPTDPDEAGKNKIRSLSNDSMEKKLRMGRAVKNIIHSSASIKEARQEIDFFFYPWEIQSLK